MALLKTHNLCKSFGGLQAIDKVSLEVEANTVHGLIGPNGSGKSTFFNLLTGVYQPDRGSQIVFNNIDESWMGQFKSNAPCLSHDQRTFDELRSTSDHCCSS